MIKRYSNSLPLWHFENLSSNKQILHFVTSREGGFSTDCFASFNVGFGAGEDNETTLRNRSLLAAELDIDPDSIATVYQSHSNKVKVIDKKLIDSIGLYEAVRPEKGDALIADVPGICLMVQVADCVPLLLYDPVRKIAGAVHAGWRGTIKKIVHETVGLMVTTFDCNASDIMAGLGPSIGPCCYEVGDNVIGEAKKSIGNADRLFNHNISTGRPHFNLWEANKSLLLEAGLLEDNIEAANICTFCNNDIFYSYRFDKGRTGHFGAGIMIKGK